MSPGNAILLETSKIAGYLDAALKELTLHTEAPLSSRTHPLSSLSYPTNLTRRLSSFPSPFSFWFLPLIDSKKNPEKPETKKKNTQTSAAGLAGLADTGYRIY